MNFIEKIFIFTLAFTFLTMGFMFALYFDVGDMVTGGLTGGNSFRNAMAESAIALLEYSRRVAGTPSQTKTTQKYVERNEAFGAVGDMATFVKGVRKRMDRSVLVSLKRAELKRLGITCTAYIEMEALNKDRSYYMAAMKRVNILLSEKEFNEAIEVCHNAIAEAGNLNLYVLRDIWGRLVNIYYQAGMFSEGKDGAYRYASVEEAILKNRDRAGIGVSKNSWARIEQLRSSAESYYKLATTDSSDLSRSVTSSMSEQEKREARLGLVNALEKGEITRAEFMAIKKGSGL